MEPFKNIYSEEEIVRLAKEISCVEKDFDEDGFIASLVNDGWSEKELKERIRAIGTALGEFLPKEYLENLEILKRVEGKFTGLFHLVFPDFVEVYGLDYPENSLEALKIFTSGCSSEFAIRPFLIKYPEVIEILKLWAVDENEHIRRLASEGSRPRLPWGIALSAYKKDPTEVLEVLEILKDDDSEYVRKSVANHLNDISKDNPEVVKDIFKRWYGESKNRDWVVKHGARTLLKAGDSDVLEIFGFSSEGIDVLDLEVGSRVRVGEYIDFSFKISSAKSLGKLRIEYKVGLVRQKGKMGYKVFKISERDLSEREIFIERSHSFKPVTTRVYYEGIHTITVVINGKEFVTKEFYLEVEKS